MIEIRNYEIFLSMKFPHFASFIFYCQFKLSFNGALIFISSVTLVSELIITYCTCNFTRYVTNYFGLWVIITVKSRFNEWPPSAPFDSLNRDFNLNLDSLNRDITVYCPK